VTGASGSAPGQEGGAEAGDERAAVTTAVLHDFKNLLSVIFGHSELLLGRLAPADPLRRHAESIKSAVELGTTLAQQLTAANRGRALQPVTVDVNAVVTRVAALFQRLVEDVTVATRLDVGAGWVRVEPAELERVIMNLVLIAREAMPAGGVVTITTRGAELDAGRLRRSTDPPPGAFVMLEVADTGGTPTPGARGRGGEPRAATRPEGRGRAPELAGVVAIVRKHGGDVTVKREPGGSIYSILLPRTEPAVTPSPAETPRARPAPGGTEGPPGTVLVVEDETGVREIIRDVLDLNGYSVLEARNGAEALSVASAHAGPVHLMISDLRMPGMSLDELVSRIRAARPDIRLMYTSGHSEEEAVRERGGPLPAPGAYLQKPFSVGDLAAAVRRILQAPAP
jgi:two-component system cell cycle sensor histidine kinase/response regulator CckA